MLSIILEQYNQWVKNPSSYLDSQLYIDQYDQNFPPMQVMGNLITAADIASVAEQLQAQSDGTFSFEKSDINAKVDFSQKLLIIALEPLASSPNNSKGDIPVPV